MRFPKTGLTIGAFLFVLLFAVATVFAGGNSETGVDGTGGSGGSVGNASSARLRIVATTSIVGDVVSQIVGDSADLKVLMPRGQNPHSYEPTPRDIVAIERANLIFMNGLGLEEELSSVLAGFPDAPVAYLSDAIVDAIVDDTLLADSEHDGTADSDAHAHEDGNPHLWFSVHNVMEWVETIRDTLTEADPSNQKNYTENAIRYLDELKALDTEISRMVETVPALSRKLVMDHDSMAYFARDYGFEIIGLIIPTFSDQSEASARDVASLVELIKKVKVEAIFVGETAGRALRKLVNAVAAESGRDIEIVELLSGSLAESGSRGDNYIDFMRYNTQQITEALRP